MVAMIKRIGMMMKKEGKEGRDGRTKTDGRKKVLVAAEKKMRNYWIEHPSPACGRAVARKVKLVWKLPRQEAGGGMRRRNMRMLLWQYLGLNWELVDNWELAEQWSESWGSWQDPPEVGVSQVEIGIRKTEQQLEDGVLDAAPVAGQAGQQMAGKTSRLATDITISRWRRIWQFENINRAKSAKLTRIFFDDFFGIQSPCMTKVVKFPIPNHTQTNTENNNILKWF